MKLATTSCLRTLNVIALGLALAMLAPAAPAAAGVLEEHVTGGNLDLGWLNGFGVSQPAAARHFLGHPPTPLVTALSGSR
jgi:hypothetical protein